MIKSTRSFRPSAATRGRRVAGSGIRRVPVLRVGPFPLLWLLPPLLLSAGVGLAQPDPQRGPDPMRDQLFPAEVVMAHQAEIGLSADQRETLIRELQSTQADIVPFQVEASRLSEELVRLLSDERVDEDRAIAQAGEVMALEARIKARHLRLLVRVKNLLSAEQQVQLRELDSGRRGAR